MLNSKLLELFKTLNKSELRAFKEWIQSNIHNQHKEVVLLYDFLFTRRSSTSLSYSKERAFAYIYGAGSYNDLRMRHLMSLAVTCLTEFVRYNTSLSEEIYSDILLAKDLHHRKLDKSAAQLLENTEKKLAVQPERSARYYLHAFELEAEKMQQIGTGARVGTNNLQQITTNLSHFFIINTLRYACVHLSHLNLRQSDCKIAMLDAVLLEITQGGYNDCPAVMIYYATYNALLYPEQEAHFQQLKHYLLHHAEKFPSEEYNNLFLQALNYCIKRLNVGSETYKQAAFELYKYGLENKVLFDGDTISQFTFKNTVALGIALGELDWVERFIPAYIPHLQPEYRATYLHYNTARLHFARGAYKDAMRLLAQIEYDDVFMNMDAKVLLLKMYYEEGAYNALESLLQSFYTALQRKKIMGYHREHYRNIISFTKKILALPPKDTEAKRQLIAQIEATANLAEKPWLLKQLN